jgi:DNA-binding GntR family transcriptional regulator
VARVVDALRELILDARLPPGHALREEALSAEHGVNRHTVRAALQVLASQRLVTVVPYRGARVREFSDDDIIALMHYRIALEGEAVRVLRQSSRGTVFALPEAVVEANRHLREVCEQSPHDHRAIELAHARLHHAIVEAAGSTRITEAHAGLEDELLLFLNQLRPLLPADEMADQHDILLVDIVERGDTAVREHLTHSAAQLIGLRAASGQERSGQEPSGQER